MFSVLYSSKEVLRTSACDFWCAILSPKNEGDVLLVKVEWLPSYSELKRALEIYGFLLDSSSKSLCNMEIVSADSDCAGPPQNIRAWIKYVAVCCQVRNLHEIFSTSEVEELVGMIICLFLDRQILGLSVILSECLLSVIRFFTVDEWNGSCEKIAKSLACRVPSDINCVAFQFLITCFGNKDLDAEEVLRLLISVNVKDKSCDLFKVYIHLCLTENWLLSNPMFKSKPVIYEMWGVYLRNCSCQIGSTDLRSFASKVRSKASYLLQGNANK